MRVERSPRSPGNVVLTWVSAYNAHDAEAAAALYHERAINLQHPWGKATEGRDAMRDTYRRVFEAFPDLRVEVDPVVEEGRSVVVEWRFSGTMRGSFAGHAPTGRRFTLRGCEVFEVEDGRIRVQRGYWDRGTMFDQLGIG